MNKDHWRKFYNKKHDLKPSSFAVSADKFIPKGSRILDMGCGNGRDSYYFGKQGHYVTGIDFAAYNEYNERVNFINMDIEEIYRISPENYDVIYSRFFLHAIQEYQVKKILRWSKGLFCAECRVAGDEPVVYKDHKRNLMDSNKLIQMFIDNDFEILHIDKSRGLAKYKNEDPLVLRIIAYK